MGTITLQSAAKINLHLEIQNPRPDGFHNLVSLFHLVSLHDTVVLRNLSKRGQIVIDGNIAVAPHTDIMYRAVEEFRAVTNNQTGIGIRIDKKIPIGAGLGGGSSNAAAVLCGLNLLLKTELPFDKLCAIGEILGSDVPYFLYNSAALVKGRGEKVVPLPSGRRQHVGLYYPGIFISTADAFCWHDSDGFLFDGWPETVLVDRFLNTRPETWQFGNSFERSIRKRFSKIDHALRLLEKSACLFYGLSGSGSAVFWLTNGANAAKKIGEQFSGEKVWIGEMLDRTRKPVLQ